MSEPLETRVVTVPTAVSTHLKDRMVQIAAAAREHFFPKYMVVSPPPVRSTLFEVAKALAAHSGVVDEWKPDGCTPKILHRYAPWRSIDGNTLVITRASIGVGPDVAHVTYLKRGLYQIDRVAEFPSGKTLAEFDPAAYLS